MSDELSVSASSVLLLRIEIPAVQDRVLADIAADIRSNVLSVYVGSFQGPRFEAFDEYKDEMSRWKRALLRVCADLGKDVFFPFCERENGLQMKYTLFDTSVENECQVSEWAMGAKEGAFLFVCRPFVGVRIDIRSVGESCAGTKDEQDYRYEKDCPAGFRWNGVLFDLFAE